MKNINKGAIFHFPYDIMFWLKTIDLNGIEGAVCLTTGVYATYDQLKEKGFSVDKIIKDANGLEEFLRMCEEE